MEHIRDLTNRGHEVIILRDTVTQLYAVDIRADAFDGEIIAGYAEFPTEDDARRVAFAYIDGLEKGKRHRFDPETQIAIVWSVDDLQELAEISDKDAMDLLKKIESGHDATIGITWDTLEYYLTDAGYDLKEKE